MSCTLSFFFIGNHAQLFNQLTGKPLLLDPTIGFIAIGIFNQIASGKPIPLNHIVSFYSRNDVNKFNRMVIDSLVYGHYRPIDLLYFNNYENMLKGNLAAPQVLINRSSLQNRLQYGKYANISPLMNASELLSKIPAKDN